TALTIADANTTISASRTTATAIATRGCRSAPYDRPTANASSSRLNAQLLNGSGLVFAAARAPALVKWVVIATDPPSSAASACAVGDASPRALTATSAPPTGRTTVCTASHSE